MMGQYYQIPSNIKVLCLPHPRREADFAWIRTRVQPSSALPSSSPLGPYCWPCGHGFHFLGNYCGGNPQVIRLRAVIAKSRNPDSLRAEPKPLKEARRILRLWLMCSVIKRAHRKPPKKRRLEIEKTSLIDGHSVSHLPVMDVITFQGLRLFYLLRPVQASVAQTGLPQRLPPKHAKLCQWCRAINEKRLLNARQKANQPREATPRIATPKVRKPWASDEFCLPALTIQLPIRQADNSPAKIRQSKPALLFQLKGCKMASNKELQEQLDEQEETISQARDILEDAYTPEATRADLVSAVSEALDVLSGEGAEEEEEEDEPEGE